MKGERSGSGPGGSRPRGEAEATALRLLARRPLTEHEIRQRLEAAGHDAASIDAAIQRLRDGGYVDDRALALDYIVTRAERLGHGPERLLEDLCRRGVTREAAEAAWTLAVEQDGVNPRSLLRREIRRRLRGVDRLGPRDYRRVYSALLRAGFDAEAVRRELKPRRIVQGSLGADFDDEMNDDWS